MTDPSPGAIAHGTLRELTSILTHDLVMTSQAFIEMIRQLSRSGKDRVHLPCGISRMPDRWEWLVSGPGDARSGSPAVVFVRATHSEMLEEAVRTTALQQTDGNRVILGVGIGPAAGHFAGLVITDDTAAVLGTVRVIAPGLPRLPLRSNRLDQPLPAALADRAGARFSRTIGALGEPAFDRLRSLRFAVIGCGRTGSIVVDHLAAHGVAGLALIDPDVIEVHNLGEMVGDLGADLGRAKATALAESVLRRDLGTAVTATPTSVQSLDALFAVKPADVLISCPDNLSARFATACVAALYLKPVLDIGTGILRGRTGREMGFDVRWLLPGWCVNCVGGQRHATSEPRRLGSLRSLNTWSVGLGFTLLEQFLAGSLVESLWMQGDVSADGVPRLERTSFVPSRGCRICAQAGHGDAGLGRLEEIIRATTV